MLVSWRYLNILCMIFFCAFLVSPSQSYPENSLQRHWLVGIEHYILSFYPETWGNHSQFLMSTFLKIDWGTTHQLVQTFLMTLCLIF